MRDLRQLYDCVRRRPVAAQDVVGRDGSPEGERIMNARSRSAECSTGKHSPRHSPIAIIPRTKHITNNESSSGIQPAIPAPVSSSFCVPHATQFAVRNKSFYISSITYVVADQDESQILFKMKTEGGFLSHPKRRFYDAASGEVLLVMKRKVPFFGTNSWVAFDGPDSESESQVLFTLRRKRFSMGSSRVSLEGFLPDSSNDSSSEPDFLMVAKSWKSEYCVRLSNGTPIAEGKQTGFQGVACSVDVYPDVDRAFIAALSMIWILEYFSDNGSQLW